MKESQSIWANELLINITKPDTYNDNLLTFRETEKKIWIRKRPFENDNKGT